MRPATFKRTQLFVQNLMNNDHWRGAVLDANCLLALVRHFLLRYLWLQQCWNVNTEYFREIRCGVKPAHALDNG